MQVDPRQGILAFMFSDRGLRKIYIVNLVNSVTKYGGFPKHPKLHECLTDNGFLNIEFRG